MQDKYVVFNKYGKRIKTVVVTSIEEFENELRKEKLYAQRQDCFEDRSEQWNRKSFRGKLESLGWEFDRNGKLINTEW